jgi:hypothetical protein
LGDDRNSTGRPETKAKAARSKVTQATTGDAAALLQDWQWHRVRLLVRPWAR